MAETRLLISIIGSAAERGARVVSKALESIGLASLEAGKKVEIFNAKYQEGMKAISEGSQDLTTAEGKLALFEDALLQYATGAEEAAAGSDVFADSLNQIQDPDLGSVKLDTTEVEKGAGLFEQLSDELQDLKTRGLAGFDAAFDGAITKVRGLGVSLKETIRRLTSFKSLSRGIVAGATLYGIALGAVATASKDLNGALKILDIRLRLVGRIAGATRSEILDLSKELSALYGLDSTDLIRGFERIGRFANIKVELRDIAKAAADLEAVSPNLNITQAIQQFGEVLNDPIRNLNRFRDLGIQFSDVQRKAFIDDFNESGSSIMAQTAILEQFNEVIGGAALGNIDSIGGAIKNLGNAFEDLFTSERVASNFKDDVTQPIADAVNDLASVLRSPAVTGVFEEFSNIIVFLTAKLIDLGQVTFGAIGNGIGFVAEKVADGINAIANPIDFITGQLDFAKDFEDAADAVNQLNKELEISANTDFGGFEVFGREIIASTESSNERLIELRNNALDVADTWASIKFTDVISTKDLRDDKALLKEFEAQIKQLKQAAAEQSELGLDTTKVEQAIAAMEARVRRLKSLLLDDLTGDSVTGTPREGGTETGGGRGGGDGGGGPTGEDIISDLQQQIVVAGELNEVTVEYMGLVSDLSQAEIDANGAVILQLIEKRNELERSKDSYLTIKDFIKDTADAVQEEADAQAGLSKERQEYNKLLAEFPDMPQHLRDEAEAILLKREAQLEVNKALKESEELYKDIAKAMESTLTPLEKQEAKIQDFIAGWGQLTDAQRDSLGGVDAYIEALRRLGVEYEEIKDKGEETWLDLEAVAEQAARSMHSNFEQFFFDVMQGDFDNLADSFKRTIDRMVANLLASQLMDMIAGKGEGGKMGGLLGGFLNMFIPDKEETQLSEGNPAAEAIAQATQQAASSSTEAEIQAGQTNTQAVVGSVQSLANQTFKQNEMVGGITSPVGLSGSTIASLSMPVSISTLSINQLAQAIGREVAAASGGGSAGGGGGGGGFLSTIASFLPFPYNLIGGLGGLGGGGGGGSSPSPSSTPTGGPSFGFMEKGGFISPNKLVEVNERGEEIVRVGGMDILLPSPTTKIQSNTPLPVKGFAKGGLVSPRDIVEVNELGSEALSIKGEQVLIGSGGRDGSFDSMQTLIREQRSMTTSEPKVFHIGERTFLKMGNAPGFVIPHDKTREIIDKQVTREAIPGREFGGAVQSRSVYEVNEGVMPELLTIGSRDFLLTGGTSGYVTPMESASQLGTNQNVNITIVTPDVDGFRKTQGQIQNELGRAANLANRRNG